MYVYQLDMSVCISLSGHYLSHVHGPMSDFSEPTSSIYKGINENNSSDDIHDYLTDNTDLKADKTQNSQ